MFHQTPNPDQTVAEIEDYAVLRESLGLESGEEQRLIDRRLMEWRGEFDVRGKFEEFQLRQLVTESVRVERCQAEERSKLAAITARAERTWEADRRSSVHAVAAKLHRNPERWRNELLRTAHGCLWMIEQWNGLLDILAVSGSFDPRRRSRALDLLGVPILFREGRTPLDPAEGETQHDLAAKIRGEIEFLRNAHEESLRDLDATDRERAVNGFAVEEDRRLQAMRRYEAGCRRRFEGLLKTLKRRDSKLLVERDLGPTTEFASRASLDELFWSEPNETERLSISKVVPPEPFVEPEPRTEPLPDPVRSDPPARSVPPAPVGNRRQRRKAAALAKRGGR